VNASGTHFNGNRLAGRPVAAACVIAAQGVVRPVCEAAESTARFCAGDLGRSDGRSAVCHRRRDLQRPMGSTSATTYEAGGTFVAPAGEYVEVGNSGGVSARMISTAVLPKHATLLIFADVNGVPPPGHRSRRTSCLVRSRHSPHVNMGLVASRHTARDALDKVGRQNVHAVR
jgi:hypothetical protein